MPLFYQCWGRSIAEGHTADRGTMVIYSICKLCLASFSVPFKHPFSPSDALLCDSSQAPTQEEDAP